MKYWSERIQVVAFLIAAVATCYYLITDIRKTALKEQDQKIEVFLKTSTETQKTWAAECLKHAQYHDKQAYLDCIDLLKVADVK